MQNENCIKSWFDLLIITFKCCFFFLENLCLFFLTWLLFAVHPRYFKSLQHFVSFIKHGLSVLYGYHWCYTTHLKTPTNKCVSKHILKSGYNRSLRLRWPYDRFAKWSRVWKYSTVTVLLSSYVVRCTSHFVTRSRVVLRLLTSVLSQRCTSGLPVLIMVLSARQSRKVLGLWQIWKKEKKTSCPFTLSSFLCHSFKVSLMRVTRRHAES